MDRRVKILHLITTLDTGGAEMMLAKLVSAMDRDRFPCRVVSLIPPGPVADLIMEQGVDVSDLGLSLGSPRPGAIFKLWRIIREFKPDVVQTWLYHADLLGLFTARIFSRAKVVWNIRCSHIDLAQYSRQTAATVKLCSMLSGLPDAVVANSAKGRSFHLDMGYRPKRFEVIPNGFDLSRFAPDRARGARIREELGVGPEDLCFTMVARFDPMKDHETLLKAFALLKKDNVHLILCGDGVDPDNASLYGLVEKYSLDGRVRLLGRRSDVPDILAGTDVFVLASKGEGFPNVVGEAMACGVPAAASDVGDVAEIVGDAGVIVEPENAGALAKALCGMIEMTRKSRQSLGEKGRRRISNLYSLEAAAARYENFYESL